ncbi:hypothetical protein PR001_g9545 [Phytophthora rubi]|uniref:Uncharacterized protein n=1 Tax=Phytophthora rubi TaxID=129364 RepID=A0A6A3MT94_9STRA|nr:hypothetical protein PR002_g11164 [Phytophthora rubi]KAE9034868.1 hypothetical protein PR001_g9545 [Phytophthora rubi]
MEEALVDYLEENCLYTLSQMQEMLEYDFGVRISTSLISKKLCDKLYTVKQVRIESEACNNAVNIEKRTVFREALLNHSVWGLSSYITMKPITICIVSVLKAAQVVWKCVLTKMPFVQELFDLKPKKPSPHDENSFLYRIGTRPTSGCDSS